MARAAASQDKTWRSLHKRQSCKTIRKRERIFDEFVNEFKNEQEVMKKSAEITETTKGSRD